MKIMEMLKIEFKALAKISRMVKDGVFRKNLLEAKTHDDFVRIIAQKDDEY